MALEGEYVPSPWQWVRDQVEQYERSGGREANTLLDTGLPIIIVTTRGNKSGTLRKTALMRVEHEGEYALVASMGGAPKNPAWYWNVKANPEVHFTGAGLTGDYVAREAEGDERARLWAEAVDYYDGFATYQGRTDGRRIPVIVLEPVRS